MHISMMEAYIIEDLKSNGETYESFTLKLQAGTVTEDEQQLKPLADNRPEVLKAAFNGQYKISFVTLGGLRNLIKMRFGIPLDSYRVEANGIFDLSLDEETIEAITSLLSINWTVEKKGDTVSFYVKGR